MGTIVASVEIDKVESILQDPSNGTWSAAEHLQNLNDAMRAIVNLKPKSYAVTQNLLLAVGVKQSLPSYAAAILGTDMSNMGTDGSTRTRGITLVDQAVMNSVEPNWKARTTAGEILHFMYDRMNPRVFWIYPGRPATPTWYVEATIGKLPSDIISSAVITLDDIYENAIMYFMLYRAWMKKKPDLAQSYYNAMLSELGIKKQTDQQDDINRKPVAGGMPI